MLLSVLVQQQLFRGFLADYDVDATAGRKGYVDSLLTESPTFGELSPEFRDLVADADGQFRGQTLTEVAVPNVDTLRTMYANDPASLGLICVRHILVETEVEARTILDELRGGRRFRHPGRRALDRRRRRQHPGARSPAPTISAFRC